MSFEQKDILRFWIEIYFHSTSILNIEDILSQSLCQKFLESSNRLLFVYQDTPGQLKISPRFVPNAILFHSPLSKEKPPFSIPPLDASEVYLISHIKSVLYSFPKVESAKLQNLITDLQDVVETKFVEISLQNSLEEFHSQSNTSSANGRKPNIENTSSHSSIAAILPEFLASFQESHEKIPAQVLNHFLETQELQQFRDWYLSLDSQQQLELNKFGTSISSFVLKRLREIDTWKYDFLKMKIIYDAGIQILSCLFQSKSNANSHLLARMKEILSIRTELSQIEYYLLSKQHHIEDFRTSINSILEKVDPLHFSEYTSDLWKETLAVLREELKTIEQSILRDIQTQIASHTDNIFNLTNEFMRNKSLILSLKEELLPERKLLLQQVITHFTTKRIKFEELSFEIQQKMLNIRNSESGNCLEVLYSGITYAAQLQKKLSVLCRNVMEFSNNDNLLASLVSTMNQKLYEFSEVLEDYYRSRRQEWENEVLHLNSVRDSPLLIFNEILQLTPTGEGTCKISYSFNHHVQNFLHQYNTMEKIFYQPIHKEIIEFVSNANDYISHTRRLNQSITFFNRSVNHILPCQQKMFHGLQLEIQEKIAIYQRQVNCVWNKKLSIKFLTMIKDLIDRFAAENLRFRRFHNLIGSHVVELMSINLLIDREKWNEKVSEIRKLFQKLEIQFGNGISMQNSMLEWEIHWEHQLYKAFEYQYQLGLQTLNEHSLTEMNVELVFKEKRIQYIPSIEKIRELYFRKLRDFLSFPLKFKGLGCMPQIYREMVGRNNEALQIVYKKGQLLFSKLEKVVKTFQSLVILGSVSNWEYISQKLQSTEDFYTNFVKMKEKRLQLEKIDNQIKRDCVTISTRKVKQAVEDQLQKLEEFLIDTLRVKANSHLKSIDKFIEDSLKLISEDPQSLEDIGSHYSNCKSIIEKKRIIFEEFHQFESKSAMLKKLIGVGLSASNTRDRWNEFMETLRAQSKVLSERRVNLKEEVSSRSSHFQNEIIRYRTRWLPILSRNVTMEMFSDSSFVQNEMTFLQERREDIADLKNRGMELIKEISFFDPHFTSFPELDQLEESFMKYASIWRPYESFLTTLHELKTQEWILFKRKLDIFEDFIISQRSIMLSQETERTPVVAYILRTLDVYEQLLSPLKFLHGDGWTLEHWIQLFHILNIQPKDLSDVSHEKPTYALDRLLFGHFVDRALDAIQHFEEIKALNSRAMGENVIRKSLQELQVWESTAEFTLIENEISQKKISLIKEWKDILTQLGEYQSLLASLRDHQYAHLFSDEIAGWDTKLNNLDLYLRKLHDIQRKWIYLAPIFFRGSLPSEQARFFRLDSTFRSIMQDIQADPRLLQLARRNIGDTLDGIIEQLQICQHALNEYLEAKRERFPRFYFLGDDDLLEILGQSKKPSIIQSHLKKLFAGIHSVVFSANFESISAMCSVNGEEVTLVTPVPISDMVEEWLLILDREMRNTLTSQLEKSLEDINTQDIISLLNTYPSQILCLSQNILFTKECEAAIKSNSLNTFHKSLKEKLKLLTAYNPRNVTQSQREINVLELKVKALIFDIIHNIDVIDHLIQKGVRYIEEWMWQKQLRYYYKEPNCVIRMCDAEFLYSFEYQGNTQKLVHTPLTDKCYLTLTQGMHLGYGGSPYGPAGTGKTESVKALGSTLGRLVLVQNCDEGIDFKSMGRIFFGLVKCGAWGCFDEFNRLKEDQLSAVSQQIQVIQQALKIGNQSDNTMPVIELNGRTTEVNPNSGIFVTLNPAGKHYGGRSKLPDNLKQLFRSVSMSKPDEELIAEVILFSEGFENAKTLSKQLVTVFQLCKQLLSPQQHYDWGLRALKTILKVGGDLIKQHRNSTNTDNSQSLLLESEIIIKALTVNTVSKLTRSDLKVFEGILTDMYPDIIAPTITYTELEQAVKEVLIEKHLQVIPSQIQKILQFYEAIKQRMGVVVVGPSGSGKSTCWQVCHEALKRLGQDVKCYICNPKSISRDQLLGYMDPDTRVWSDGILTANARKVSQEPLSTQSWILCDGDIDPKWIESLNSVLDDNRLLSMPTGERIQFTNNVNFVFETHSLKFASPATVSRMGMIFFSEDDIPVECLVAKWLQTQSSSTSVDLLRKFMSSYFTESINILIRDFSSSFVVNTTKVGIVLSALSAEMAQIESKMEFCQILIRNLGGYLKIEDRIQFAKQIFQLCNEKPVDMRKPLDCYYLKSESKFAPFVSQPTTLKYDDLFKNAMISTVDMQRTQAIITPWLTNKEPFILVGPKGSGKSMLLQNCIGKLKNTQCISLFCNSQTQASNVIQKLLQSCILYTTGNSKVIRPRESENLILYLRDINLPKPDEYGTSQLISFLQQVLCYNGFYDDELDFVQLERIQIVSSMNPSSTVGRYPLSARLTSIVRICSLTYPESEQLISIYTEFTKAVIERLFDTHPIWSAPANLKLLSTAMVTHYKQVVKSFIIDDYSHYVFTPRDLTEWIIGLANYEINSSNDPSDLLDVWTFEGRRIFKDKIIDEKTYASIEANTLKLFADLGYQCKIDEKRVIYTSLFLPFNKDKARYRVLQKTDMKQLAIKTREGMKHFERDNRKLRILLIPETVEYIARIDRVLSRDGGCLLLAGQSGIGRSNIVSLLCYLHRIELYTPKMIINYSFKHLKQDFKYLFQLACFENKTVCFFLEDHQNIDPAFLEHINSLIASGEFPGLYTKEEFDSILIQLKDIASISGFTGSPYEFMTQRAKQNIRIILSMNPSHPLFNIRCQSNPSILSQCSIQWKTIFSSSGYLKLPKLILKEILANHMSVSNIIPNDIIVRMVKIHLSMSESNSSPAYFIQFLDTFKTLYMKKLEETKETQSRYTNGLKKLHDAELEVDRLSKNAQDTKKLLAEKRAQTKKALAEIDINMKDSAQESADIEKLRSKISAEEEKIREKEIVIQDQLKDIQPLIDSAKDAVGSLSTRSLGYIRSLPMPPNSIRDVLSGVLRLMGNNDTSWKGMKKFIGERGVVNDILNLDPRTISTSLLESVKEHIAEKAESFNEKNIQRVNAEAAVLAKWVTATVSYAEVLKKVGPLENEAKILKASGEKLKHHLSQCENKLNALQEKIQILQEELKEKTKEVASLGNQLEKAEKTLGSAQSLLSKLSEEKERWLIQNSIVHKQLKDLPYLSILSSAFITYLSSYPEDFRAQKLKTWTELLELESFNFCSFIVPESQILKYRSEGLPSDQLSQENAIVILHCIQTPLIIDPSQQATQWLKQHLSSKNIDTTISSSTKFASQLELAIRFGKILIVEEVDSIDPILYPLLRKELIIQGPRKSILVGDKIVDFNEEFQLFLVTRDSNIILPPDASPLLTQINFTVTRSGLEGQLLGITIDHENPGLEQQRQQELQKEESQKIKLADLESELLTKLSSTENLLQDSTLIASLDTIKINSIEIKHSLEQSIQVRNDIEKSRNFYQTFAEAGSVLFFLILDLPKLNRMYQFSLNSFLKIFKETLEKAPFSNELNQRLSNLSSHLRASVYNYYCRSLFKNDQPLFAMHLCKGLFPNLIDEKHWNFFMGNHIATNDVQIKYNSPTWIPSDRVLSFQILNACLPELVSRLQLNENTEWKTWLNSTNMHSDIPKSISSVASDFELIILVQTLKPSQLTNMINYFVLKHFGLNSITPPPLALKEIYENESSKDEPILLISTPGSDPSIDLQRMAYHHPDITSTKFHQLAMGQGQTEEAILLLKRCAKNGEWLCLKNLHLVTSWITNLEMELSQLQDKHNNFRLWLTTDVHDEFPIILLRESLKFTFEAPPGMKQNLLRTVTSWDNEFINRGNDMRTRLLFLTAFFHAIIQERRSYIPLGWTKFYEFSNSDLRSSLDIIETYFQKSPENPDWDSIHGIFEYAIYGGGVDDQYDLLRLKTYLQKIFNQNVFTHANSKIAPGVTFPFFKTKDEFLSFIQENFSDMDSPELFGLPSNATAIMQISRGQYLVSGLKKLTHVGSNVAKSTFTRDHWAKELSPLIQFWKNLTSSNYDILFQNKFKSKESDDPITLFLSLEFSNALLLVRSIDDNFNEIQEILRGTAILSSTMQDIASHLFIGDVPQVWQDKWEGSQNARKYIQAVVQKTVSLSKLILMSIDSILQSPIDLSIFFNPNVFLNALKQRTARSSSVSLDQLNSLVTSWEYGSLKQYSSTVIRIKNLLLQGAQFNNTALTKVSESTDSFIMMPECEMGWCTKEYQEQYFSKIPSMNAPLYMTPSREIFLTNVTLPCDDVISYTLSGTCLLVSGED